MGIKLPFAVVVLAIILRPAVTSSAGNAVNRATEAAQDFQSGQSAGIDAHHVSKDGDAYLAASAGQQTYSSTSGDVYSGIGVAVAGHGEGEKPGMGANDIIRGEVTDIGLGMATTKEFHDGSKFTAGAGVSSQENPIPGGDRITTLGGGLKFQSKDGNFAAQMEASRKDNIYPGEKPITMMNVEMKKQSSDGKLAAQMGASRIDNPGEEPTTMMNVGMEKQSSDGKLAAQMGASRIDKPGEKPTTMMNVGMEKQSSDGTLTTEGQISHTDNGESSDTEVSGRVTKQLGNDAAVSAGAKWSKRGGGGFKLNFRFNF